MIYAIIDLAGLGLFEVFPYTSEDELKEDVAGFADVVAYGSDEAEMHDICQAMNPDALYQ